MGRKKPGKKETNALGDAEPELPPPSMATAPSPFIQEEAAKRGVRIEFSSTATRASERELWRKCVSWGVSATPHRLVALSTDGQCVVGIFCVVVDCPIHRTSHRLLHRCILLLLERVPLSARRPARIPWYGRSVERPTDRMPDRMFDGMTD